LCGEDLSNGALWSWRQAVVPGPDLIFFFLGDRPFSPPEGMPPMFEAMNENCALRGCVVVSNAKAVKQSDAM